MAKLFDRLVTTAAREAGLTPPLAGLAIKGTPRGYIQLGSFGELPSADALILATALRAAAVAGEGVDAKATIPVADGKLVVEPSGGRVSLSKELPSGLSLGVSMTVRDAATLAKQIRELVVEMNDVIEEDA